MNEMFAKECEEIGFPLEEFPFDFAASSPVDFPTLTDEMMWILKKRQDKMKQSSYMIPEDFDTS